MILRKFQQHVKNRNWVAFGLDIIVLVVGIFLGMQLNDWNEDRKAQVEGYYYLDLLRQQLNRDILRREAEITHTSNDMDKIQHAFRLLHADSWTDKELEEFTEQHRAIYNVHHEKLRPSALRQLVDAGKVDLVRSRQMQEKLFILDQKYEEAITQSKITKPYFQHAIETLIGEIHYGSNVDINSIGTVIPPEILLNSKKLKDAMYLVFQLNSIQLNALRHLQEESIKARDILDGYLESRGIRKSINP